MIRVNVLGRERPKVRRPFQLKGPWLAAPLIVPFMLAGFYGWWRAGEVVAENTHLQTEIAEFERKKLEMQDLQTKMQALERQEAQLKARLDVIKTLQRNQAGPMLLMENVGSSVSRADTVWLTAMADQGGGKIEFKGNAASMEAVANLMTQLSRSPYFKDVEIQESAEVPQSQGDDAGTFTFTVTAVFALPEPEGEEAGAAPAQPAAAATSSGAAR